MSVARTLFVRELSKLIKDPLERQGNGANGCLSGGECSSGLDDLFSNKSQRHTFLFQRRGGNAGNLAHILALVLNLGPSRRSRALHFESDKGSMHRAACPNPLHNFLAYVAALGEVEGAILPGFLR